MAKSKQKVEFNQCDTILELSRQVAAMRDEIHEVKEILAAVAMKLDCRQCFMLAKPNLHSSSEDRIPLEAAVPIVWGKSAAKDGESLQIHTDFLKHWATTGLNAAVLETDIVDGKWYTSRQAVERFQVKLNAALPQVSDQDNDSPTTAT